MDLYERGGLQAQHINPSIHQAKAAAKDLISSGASKHGVLAVISFYRDRNDERTRRGGSGRASSRGYLTKIRIALYGAPRAAMSKILSPTCRQIYLSMRYRRAGTDVAPIVACV